MENKSKHDAKMKETVERVKEKLERQRTQELSVEDLDKVAGGGFDGYFLDGVPAFESPGWGVLTVDEYYDIVKWTYDSYGEDIAVGLALDIYPSVFIESSLRTGGPEYMRDTLRARIISASHGGNSILSPYSIWGN